MRIHALALVGVAVLCSGCAVFYRENTPTLNFVENKLVPEKNPARTLAYTYAVPAGILAVAADAVIVRPASVVGDAAKDTESVWRDFNWNERYVSSCASVVPRAVFTPVAFTACFVGRSLFDIPTRAQTARKTKAAQKKDDEYRTIRGLGTSAEIRDIVRKARKLADSGDAAKSLQLLNIAIERSPGFLDSYQLWTSMPPEEVDPKELVAVLVPALTDDRFNDPAQAASELVPLLRDGSPRVRQFVIFRLSRSFRFVFRSKAVLQELEQIVTPANGSLAFLALDLIGRRWLSEATVFLEVVAASKDPQLSLAAKCWLAEDPSRSSPWE
ncbi:MAG TPA: hypothetical protein VM223_02915 [Planctomycetota bacterium]|nr:hypothetical protein [Planctomycetota bacterium]